MAEDPCKRTSTGMNLGHCLPVLTEEMHAKSLNLSINGDKLSVYVEIETLKTFRH